LSNRADGIGNKRDLIGFGFKDQIDGIVLRIAFDVEFCINYWLEIPCILVTDVALVWPRMDRDAVCSKTLYVCGCLEDI
jgi:hypothetical protein